MTKTFRQLALAAALSISSFAASAADCLAGTFTDFVNCTAIATEPGTITLTANVQPDGTPVASAFDLTVLNNGFLLDGPGVLAKGGAGSLILPAANTYIGGTVIAEGFVALGDPGALGTGGIILGGGGVLGTGDFSIGGAGILVQAPVGVIAALPATTLQVNNVSVAAGAVVAFGSPAFTGTINLAGTGTMDPTGSVLLDGGIVRAFDATMLTTLTSAAATTAISATGVLDTLEESVLVANIAGTGEIAISGSGGDLVVSGGTYGGVISGAGALLKVSPGTLTLTGANTYAGVTAVDGGILQIGDGGTTGTLGSGALPVGISLGAVLQYNRTDAYEISKAIDGPGELQVIGTGSLVLSAANTYTGNTVVGAGSLVVTGSTVASAVTAVGGVLAGSGTTGLVSVTAAGTVAPGVPVGFLTTGPITLVAGSTAAFEITGPTAGTGYDVLNVSGSVDLGGATLNVSGAYVPVLGDVFVLVFNDAAEPVTGTFNGLPQGSVFTFNGVPVLLNYFGGDGNDVVLSVLAFTVTPSAGANGTIAPNTAQVVLPGGTTSFTVTPDSGFAASVGGTCGGTLVGNTYTTNAITADCTVDATFVALNVFNVVLEGFQETAPYRITPATGGGTATFNPVSKELTLNLAYSGLTSAETMAHIHGPAARGANAGILITLAVGSPKTDVAVLTPTQETQLLAGQLYVNVHTTTFGSGEIRGQIDNLGAVTPRVLTVAKDGTGTGTVTGTTEAGSVVDCGSDCGETIPDGKMADLTATAASDSTFTAWSGACTGTGACMVTMDAAKTVTATFTLNTYTVTPSAGANGTIAPNTAQTVNHGATAVFTVTPSAGYTAVVGGTCGGNLVGDTYTTNAITANCTVDATFTQITFTVTPSAGANGTIAPNTPQIVASGATTVFTVTPSAGYTAVVGGTCGGNLVGNTYTTNAVVADCTVDATFQVLVVYNVVLEGFQEVAPYRISSATGGGTATFDPVNKTLTLNLTYTGLSSTETMAHIHGPAARGANAGILFTLATGSPKTDVVTLNPTQETQLASGQLYVNVHTSTFGTGEIRGQLDNVGAVTPRVLTVVKAGTGTGTVSGATEAGTVIGCGSDCTETIPNGKVANLAATADSGSTFVGWSGACTGTGPCNVTMDAAKSVTATFDTDNPPRLGNISTRGLVLTGQDVMIGGFVIGGTGNKTVAIVATGPSLAAFGITNPMANPTLRLVRSSDQVTLATNDDWQTAANSAQLTAEGFAPTNPLEAAILISLPAGAYTAIVEGSAGGTGVSVIGVYEVDGPTIPLLNISTRGRVGTGNDVMIGGFIIDGTGPQNVAIVATGPSLAPFGITNPLANPTIRLVRSSDQATLATNDDWQTDAQSAALQAAGFAPTNTLESGLYRSLPPGAYTVIVSGVANGTGVAVIGVYRAP